jgi:hypothetical protein
MRATHRAARRAVAVRGAPILRDAKFERSSPVSAKSERRKKRYAEDADFSLRTLAYNRAFYAANPEVNRKARLKYDYGITPEQYDALLQEQNGLCAICKERPVAKLCVDHDHPTELIRGLLCRLCNLGLGHFKDDIARLRAAIVYLEAFEARVRHATGLLPPPLAGEGWGGGSQTTAFVWHPSLSLPRHQRVYARLRRAMRGGNAGAEASSFAAL